MKWSKGRYQKVISWGIFILVDSWALMNLLQMGLRPVPREQGGHVLWSRCHLSSMGQGMCCYILSLIRGVVDSQLPWLQRLSSVKKPGSGQSVAGAVSCCWWRKGSLHGLFLGQGMLEHQSKSSGIFSVPKRRKWGPGMGTCPVVGLTEGHEGQTSTWAS